MQASHKPAQTKNTPHEAEAFVPRTSWRGVARRAILCATCAATAATLMFPSTSFAAEWVSVDGQKYDTESSTETWSWDGKDDMQLNGYNGSGISAAGKLDLTYTGDNTVTNNEGRGIEIVDGEDEKAELNVSGDGSLTVESEGPAISSKGDLSISGEGTVSASSESGYAIVASGNTSIKDANVEAEGSKGIGSNGTISIENSTVTATGAVRSIDSDGSITIDGSKVNASASQEDEAPKDRAFGIASFRGDVTIKNNSLVEAIAKSSNGFGTGIYSFGNDEADGGHIAISDSTVTAVGETGKPGAGTSGVGIWAATDFGAATPASVVISRSNVNASGTDEAMTSATYGNAGDELELGTITIEGSTIAAPQDAKLTEYAITLREGSISRGTTFVVSGLSPDGVMTDIEALEDASIRKVTIEADKGTSPEPEIKPASHVTPASGTAKKVIPQTGDASATGLFASAIAGASALAAGVFMARKRES